jgi:3'(2'), 5'-bisphosphate nucleotidase
MLNSNPNPLLITAIRAALFAGEEILTIYKTDFSIEYKSDESPLTQADQNAHRVIADTLAPCGIPLLSEEGEETPYSVRKNWKTLWIVDPLDGTKEFVKKNGEFTVNIALIENQSPVLGVIYQPTNRTLYFASSQSGAFKCEDVIPSERAEEDLATLFQRAKRLPLAKERKTYTLLASRSHRGEETDAFIAAVKSTHKDLAIVSAGSSLKFCLVAEGSADLYPRFGPTNEWDTAAGQAIVECAGGTVVDCNTNQKLLYNREVILNASFIVRGLH